MATTQKSRPTSTAPVSLVERVAHDLAAAFDSRQTILVTCRLAYEGMENLEGKEATERRENLAIATSRALAELLYPGDPEAQKAAREIPNNRPGGAGVSPTAIKQRAAAYAHVLTTGLTPDILSVTAAFRLHSITGKGHADYVKAVTDATVADPSVDTFVSAANKASEALTAARPGKRGAQKTADEKGVDMTPAAVIAALSWASAHVSAFKGDERETFVALLADLSAQTA